MPTKKALVSKLTAKPLPRNFTVKDLDALMAKCNCEKYQGGRGSGIGYRHIPTGRAIHLYQVKAVIAFLNDLKEI